MSQIILPTDVIDSADVCFKVVRTDVFINFVNFREDSFPGHCLWYWFLCKDVSFVFCMLFTWKLNRRKTGKDWFLSLFPEYLCCCVLRWISSPISTVGFVCPLIFVGENVRNESKCPSPWWYLKRKMPRGLLFPNNDRPIANGPSCWCVIATLAHNLLRLSNLGNLISGIFPSWAQEINTVNQREERASRQWFLIPSLCELAIWSDHHEPNFSSLIFWAVFPEDHVLFC